MTLRVCTTYIGSHVVACRKFILRFCIRQVSEWGGTFGLVVHILAPLCMLHNESQIRLCICESCACIISISVSYKHIVAGNRNKYFSI